MESWRQNNYIENSVLRQNKVLAKVAAESIETAYVDSSWPVKTLNRISESENVSFLWLIRPDGNIFLASEPWMQGRQVKDSMADLLDVEEITVNKKAYQGKKIQLVAVPLQLGVGDKPWTLYLGGSMAPVNKAQREAILMGLGFFVLISLIAILASFYFSKGVSKPIEKLRRGTEMIGRGNFDHRIKVDSGDELEDLASAFNKMAQDLKRFHESMKETEQVLKIRVKAKTRELRQLNEELEQRVQERTKELKKRIEELERFHRLTVGREKKMIELKKENKRLREELHGRKDDQK